MATSIPSGVTEREVLEVLREAASRGQSAVTVTTNLIVEFVRAANRIPTLPQSERRRLLERGVTASGALCGLLVKIGKVAPFDESADRIIDEISSGHTHTPKILEGVYVAGVSANLDQGYDKGPTTWAHAHIVQYDNGKRTMLIMSEDGRYEPAVSAMEFRAAA